MGDTIDFARCEGSLPRTEGVANLSPAEALAFLERGALLVDLREAYETNFRVFGVPEVLYVPWTRFAASFESLPRDRALILADASGIYCREAARILLGAGYANVAKLSGGMIDWDAAGLPLRKDEDYELNGQCACKMKTRHGGNPLIDKREDEGDRRVGDRRAGDRRAKVLFLCVHNSARSQMAEAFLGKLGGGRFEAASAGLEPGRLNPHVVRAMAEVGIDISHNATKSVFELAKAGAAFDFVVTVCSKEAAERCPIFPGHAERLHWSFEDPAAFSGTDEEIMAGVRLVRDGIRAAVEDFISRAGSHLPG